MRGYPGIYMNDGNFAWLIDDTNWTPRNRFLVVLRKGPSSDLTRLAFSLG